MYNKKMMIYYIVYGVIFLDNQRMKFVKVFKEKLFIILCFLYNELIGFDEMMLIQIQIKKIYKVYFVGKGVDLKISKMQIIKVV